MNKTILLLLINSSLQMMRVAAAEADSEDILLIPKEYCQFETFQPRCLKNEVVVVTSALFGRMRFGRCIEADPLFAHLSQDHRYIGCSENVLKLLDQKCSGRTECEVRVSDHDIENTKPCAPDLKMYLEASYRCVQMVHVGRTCSIAATTVAQHLSSSFASKTECGSKSQPWMIEAQTGQQIEVDLLDFSDNTQEDGTDCHPYGYILERLTMANISICGWKGRSERESTIYRSKGNLITINLSGLSNQKTMNANFLIKIKAIGCSYLVPPQDTWLKRNGDEITIGCYSSLQTWQLRCQDHQWIGVLGNCTAGQLEKEDAAEPQKLEEQNSTKQVLALVTILGMVLVSCLLIVCIGTLCLMRYGKKSSFSDKYSSYNICSDSGFGKNQKPYVANGSLLPFQYPTSMESKQDVPSYSVYVETNGRRQDGYYDGSTSSNNENGAAQYFVLDREAVEKENGILINR